jgi:hypothetical protein
VTTLLARLPLPVFWLLLGRERFTETGAGETSAPPARRPPAGRKKSQLL